MKAVIAMLFEEDFDWRLSEIKSLCQTARYDIGEVFVQKGRPGRRFLIGRGKVDQIKDFLRKEGGDIVVFENFLTSKQALSLEEALETPVIDRFDLILNVFELHAESREAKLQIELARLKRKIPYLKMYLGRKVRSEHPGFGGSGGFIVHSTITSIHRRIKSIEKKLEMFDKRTAMQRRRREKAGRIVSLAGYTNVGKTSLLRALTGTLKPERDELFTTLRTKTGSFTYEGVTYLLNDTIGFIRDLPFQLIYAFKATLQDIAHSDLILIVHDSTLESGDFFKRKTACETALSNIGADNVKRLDVENKIDIGKGHLIGSVKVSAHTGQGMPELKNEIHRIFK